MDNNTQPQTEAADKTILLVEDNPSDIQIFADQFQLEGFTVIQEKTGDEGLKKILEVKPDLAILDIVLPGIDGIAIMKKLREDDWGKHLPIILLTNLSPTDDMIRHVSQDQPSYYLVKSDVILEDLVDKVKKILNVS